MWIRRLRIDKLRCLADAELTLEPGLQLLIGPNGAGKTSILEAAYLLSHARSFRAGPKESLVKLGQPGLSVFAEVQDEVGNRVDRLGLQRTGSRWQARINGETPPSLDALLHRVAVVCFEPGTHELVSGPGEARRSFLDWMLFHVEQDFLSGWRRYHRAVKQRNVLLRAEGTDEPSLAAWNGELIKAGEVLDRQRRRLIEAWRPLVLNHLRQFLPELGEPELEYQPGWRASDSLAEALEIRDRLDRVRGYTSVGPHRGDWRLGFARAPQREHLSRGQAKLCALACVLAQGEVIRKSLGQWPVVCLDDLGSELDPQHQASVLDLLSQTPAQILITGTAEPHLPKSVRATARFHVEQGRITRLL